jgi:hypothetical protein
MEKQILKDHFESNFQLKIGNAPEIKKEESKEQKKIGAGILNFKKESSAAQPTINLA